MEGKTIHVVVHYVGTDGISRRRRTVIRKCHRYQVEESSGRETCLISVSGSKVWAEKYPHTVWTAELVEELKP